MFLDSYPMLELLQDFHNAGDQGRGNLKPVRSREQCKLIGGEPDERLDFGVRLDVDTGLPSSRQIVFLQTS